MVHRANDYVRTLAIDPSSKGFGFVVFEGDEELLDWGVSRVWSNSDTEFLSRVASLIDRYSPTLIVIEDDRWTRHGPRARRRTKAVAKFAASRRLDVAMVGQDLVRGAFRGTGTTKYEIAQAIGNRYPELGARLPRYRKPWMSEDERMNMFDAAALALAVFAGHGLPTGIAD